MAEIIENKKGFKVIKVSFEEVHQKFRSLGICDWCNSTPDSFMYIPVLNCCYCDECYKDWMKRAVNHSEDHDFENRAFERAKQLLKIE